MTGNRWLLTGWLVAMAVILILLLVSRADFEALRTDYDASQEQNTSLSGQLQTVQSDLSQLQADYNTSEQQNTSLSGQLQLVQSDLSQLQSDYDTLSSELADIKSVYPPRDFSSVSELEDWLASNDVSERELVITYEDWYAKALEIQEDALRDGYIISVDYDYYPETGEIRIFCVTVIDGDIWYWDPEFDTVSQDTLLGKVK